MVLRLSLKYLNTFSTTVLFAFKVHNEFILPSEKEGFIHRMGDIIKRAEALMAKEQLVHSSGHRLPQPAFHTGVNSLSSSQVSISTFSFPVVHITALLARSRESSGNWECVLLRCLIIINYISYCVSRCAYLRQTHKSCANGMQLCIASLY